jgi:hypothetical protein
MIHSSALVYAQRLDRSCAPHANITVVHVALRSMTNITCIQQKLKDVLKFFAGNSLHEVKFVEGET